MVRVLVLYYSLHKHVHQLAQAVAEGCNQVDGAQVTLRRVPEVLNNKILKKLNAYEDQQQMSKEVPIIDSTAELEDYDVIIFGTPTRYGNMCGQMRQFLDATGQLWLRGAFYGKLASVFTSSATQHGGQESTITSFHNTLFQLGFIVTGLQHQEGWMNLDEIQGLSPYGASTVSGVMGERSPTQGELEGARMQGRGATTYGKYLLIGKQQLSKEESKKRASSKKSNQEVEKISEERTAVDDSSSIPDTSSETVSSTSDESSSDESESMSREVIRIRRGKDGKPQYEKPVKDRRLSTKLLNLF